MSKLTELEYNYVLKLAVALRDVEKVYLEKIDSIENFLCNQFELTTQEKATLEEARTSLNEIMYKLNKSVFHEMKMLHEHFKQERGQK